VTEGEERRIDLKELAKYDWPSRFRDSQIFLEAPQVGIKRRDGLYRAGALINVSDSRLIILAPIQIRLVDCEIVITTDKNGKQHRIKG